MRAGAHPRRDVSGGGPKNWTAGSSALMAMEPREAGAFFPAINGWRKGGDRDRGAFCLEEEGEGEISIDDLFALLVRGMTGNSRQRGSC